MTHKDTWLSAIFGHGVYRLAPGPSKREIEARMAEADGSGAAFFYARVNPARVEWIRALGMAGFTTIDVTITLGRPADGDPPEGRASDVTIEQAGPDHHEDVLRIAGSCFTHSRFHQDPAIPEAIAHRIKHDWILNTIRGRRGDRLDVALLEGRPIGFLAVLATEADGRRVEVIDLIGVDRRAQRRGAGRALVAHFIERARGSADRLRVGTQIANVASLNLYRQFGFAIESSQFIMHRHIEAPS